MTGTGSDGAFERNWIAVCTECSWESADIGSMGVMANARVHLYQKGDEHVSDVYRDDDLMMVVDSVLDSDMEYLGENTPPLREREKEHERIAREVADSDLEDSENRESDT